jgi:hypothetical protein
MTLLLRFVLVPLPLSTPPSIAQSKSVESDIPDKYLASTSHCGLPAVSALIPCENDYVKAFQSIMTLESHLERICA